MTWANRNDSKEAASARLACVKKFFEIVVSGYGTQPIIVRVKSSLNGCADIIVGTMAQPQFPVPSGKNRTKTGPAADRVSYGMQCGIALRLTQIGLKKLKFTETLTTTNDDANVKFDKKYASWNEVTDTRNNQTFAFVSRVGNIVMLIIFIITDEASRYSTHQLLYCAHKPHDTRRADEPTAMRTFFSDERSPLHQGLCNITAICNGANNKTVLIRRYMNCTSMFGWVEAYPKGAMMLFRCASQHMGQLEGRQRKYWKRLGIFGTGDRQLPEDATFERVESFVYSTATQLGDGGGVQILAASRRNCF